MILYILLTNPSQILLLYTLLFKPFTTFQLYTFIPEPLMNLISDLRELSFIITSKPIAVAIPSDPFGREGMRGVDEETLGYDQKIVGEMTNVFKVLVLVHPVAFEALIVDG